MGFEALRFGALDWRRLARSVSLYAAASVACVFLFLFLHHIGNGIPYQLAAQRYGDGDEGYNGRIFSGFEYCQFMLMTLGGADDPAADDRHALRDALFLKQMKTLSPTGPRKCRWLLNKINVEWDPNFNPTRYWWGGKALHAIALRFLSAPDTQLLILWLTGAAWIALAAALAATNQRALLILSPLIVFGALFSGTRFFLNSSIGWPYLWAVASAAALACIIRSQSPGSRQAARFFCFIAGMVSGYLWLFDSHNILASALIGMLGYFGCGLPTPKERARFALSCLALYIAGFAASIALGQAVKFAASAALPNSDAQVYGNFIGKVADNSVRTALEFINDFSGDPSSYPIVKYFPLFRELALHGVRMGAGAAMALLPWLALLAAALAWIRARQGRADTLADTLWIAGIAALAAMQFLLPEDIAFRRARYIFIFYALCASCAVLALLDINIARHARAIFRSSARIRAFRKRRAARAGEAFIPYNSRLPQPAAILRRAGYGCALLGFAAAVFLFNTRDLIDMDRIRELGDPIIQSEFDVYLDAEENELIYTKPNCSEEDTGPRVFLRFYPIEASVLPTDLERELGRANGDFSFSDILTVRSGGYCAAKVHLPDYGVAKIRTGQFTEDGNLWEAQARLDWLDDIGGPVASGGGFNLHLNKSENALTYIKEPCGQADADSRFFLHITPDDPNDLPPEIRPSGRDNLDFAFPDHGEIRNGKCRAQIQLPDYPIAQIKTGQFTDEGKIWEETFSPR